MSRTRLWPTLSTRRADARHSSTEVRLLAMARLAPCPALPNELQIQSPGYYARHYLLEALIRAFVAAVDGPTQLLLLGAGFDTRAFRYRVRLHALGPNPLHPRLTSLPELALQRQGAPYDRTTVFEVDFPRVTAAKVTTILATPALHSLWTDPVVAGTD